MPPKRPIVDVITLSDSDDDQPAPSRRRKQSPEDSFDKEMAQAMALSLADSQGSNGGASGSGEVRIAEPKADSSVTAGESREEMEKARLARQQAREANGGATAPTRKVGQAATRPKVSTISGLNTAASASTSTAAVASSSSSAVHGFASSTASSLSSSGPRPSERFWTGSLKRVSNLYVPDAESFTFDAVLGPKDQLVSAIVSAYVLDTDWTIDHFPRSVPLLLVMPKPNGGGKGEVEVMPAELRPKTFRVAPVERAMIGGWTGSMHTKVIVLYYKDFCRVVIPSANQVKYDWDRLDNVLYIHDFRRRSSFDPAEKPIKNPTHTSFSSKLFVALERLSVPPKFLGPFREFDFSTSAEVQLVVSVQGLNDGWDEVDAAGGMASMATAVKALGFSPGGKWEIEATGSSIGRYSENWLNNMLAAASGIHPKKYFNSKTQKYPKLPSVKDLPIKIVFPTLKEVDASHGGRPGGGTLFFPEKTWKMSTLPRHLLYQGQSKRQGVIAHTKTIVALHRPGLSPPDDYKPEGWIYIGSHNFTPSAWGNLQCPASRGPGIAMANYEMGVILPIRGATMAEVEAKATALATYRRPLVPYAKDDVPWMSEVYK